VGRAAAGGGAAAAGTAAAARCSVPAAVRSRGVPEEEERGVRRVFVEISKISGTLL
jgi:hypothetical protein